MRAGEKPAAGAPRLPIDPRADEGQHFRHMLHLIENHGRPYRIEKSLRVGAEPRHDVWVFEQEIAGFGKQVPEQPRLPGPARTGQDNGREIFHGLAQWLFQFSRDIAH